MRPTLWVLRMMAMLCLAAEVAPGGVNVVTYHNDNSRTGGNLNEKILTPGNVNAQSFGKLFTYAVDGDVYAQPLYASGVPIAGAGIRNVVLVATEHNSVYAFDADSASGPSGGLLWHVNFGPSVATPNPNFGNRYGGFTEITPEVGITGTPVIDLATLTLYVDAFTQDGSNYIHRIHALNISTGGERAFSPVVVSAVIRANGVGGTNGVVVFSAQQQLQRSALTLAGGILYAAYGSYGDTDPYHGWILGFDPSHLQLSADHIFNSTPNSTVADFGANAGEAGIWMGGGGLAEDAAGNLYFTTGNGSFNAFNNSGGTEYGDTFLKLSTTGGLSVADYFTPYNQAYDADSDLDVGSGGVLALPNQEGPVPHLLVGGGKPGFLYLINRDLFTAGNNHYNTNGNWDDVRQSIALDGAILCTPTYYQGTIYLTPSGATTAAFSISNGTLSLPASSIGSRTFPFPGATASLSANGNQDGILWLVERASPALLVADNASDVSEEIYNSDQAGLRDQLPGGTKFAVPTIANGKVFVGGQGALSVFGLLPFTNAPTVGHYSGLFFGSNAVQTGQSGYVTVTVQTDGQYLARLQTASSLYSFTGRFNGGGAASNSLSLPRQSPLQLQLQFSGSSPMQLTGTVGNGAWAATITADEAVFNERTNPAPFAGTYALVLPGPGDGDPGPPQGAGFGVVSVSPSGQAVFHGTLADGTAVSQTATVSADGQWPLYVSLYGGRGQILGWVSLTNTPPSDLAGDFTWIKLPIPTARSYAAGFDFGAAVEGSGSSAGPVNGSSLGLSAGLLLLSGGGLSADSTNYFTVSPGGKFSSTNGLSLSFSASSGIFRGTAPNPGGGPALSFSGIFLSKQKYGSGFFINDGLSGAVSLVPNAQ